MERIIATLASMASLTPIEVEEIKNTETKNIAISLMSDDVISILEKIVDDAIII